MSIKYTKDEITRLEAARIAGLNINEAQKIYEFLTKKPKKKK